MDKKSIIGFILMGLVVFGYMFYASRNAKERDIEQRKQAIVEQQIRQERQKAEDAENEVKARKELAQMTDSANALFMARQVNEGTTTIENELLRLTIDNKGGQISRAELKDPTYKSQEGGQVVLFDGKDSQFSLLIDGKEDNIATDEFYFTPLGRKADGVTMQVPVGSGSINIAYSLVPNSYLVHMDISAKGLSGFFPSKTKTLDIVWREDLRQQEKGGDFETRYATITYRTTDNDTEELSSMGADKEEKSFESDVHWVAFKDQFFSQILIAGDSFTPSLMSSKQIQKGDTARMGYLKSYETNLTAPFDPSGDEATALTMYLGPNKFSTLKDNEELLGADRDLDLQSLVYLGWPLIKYVNRYFILYLFDWMTSWGINMGIVLTILTLVIKFAVYPLQRKSYLSSSRMRVLKPKIEELAKKYPNKEDAMLKQQETMRLYSEYGVSPMGGCLPMLIQMPIWIALLNFIPNAIELRGQSFLWADDLSTYDDIINWGTDIWLIGDHLSLFCVLWAVSMVLSTLFTMKQQQDSAMSPEQAQTMKMMKWVYFLMPVVFFFSFNSYSSGLNYYYFFSSMVTVLMMWYLKKTTDDEKLLAQLERRYEERKKNNTGVRKTSSMMERMQEMARKQQEQLEKQRAAQQQRK
ncbi:MAG: membrane protein insertase YidC [Bacteroidaceae bacterium]|nr:membrane protein insertase YidC [Bacteroidaceae bacterium]